MAVNVYKVTFHCTYTPGGVVENVQAFSHNADDDPGPANLLEEVWDSVGTSYTALVFQTAIIDYLHAVQVPTDSTPLVAPAEATKVINVAGGRSGTDRFEDLAMCERAIAYTGIAGRSFRGGIYLPPVVDSEQLSNDGKFNTGGTTYHDKCLTFLTAMAAVDSGFTWGVYSKKRALANEADPFNNITATVMPNQQYWLRKRQIRNQ